MKIPPDLYARIVEAMRKCPTMTKENVEAHRAYLAGLPRYQPGMVGNLPKRMRWDLLYATQNTTLTREAYALGCNDEHIDTALRKAMNELGWPEFATP